MTTQIVFTRLNGDDRLAMVETAALMLLALGALALFRRADPGGSLAGVGKGTAPSLARAGSAPGPGGHCGRRLGARGAPAAAAPHAAARVLRAGRHLDHRAVAAGLLLGQLRGAVLGTRAVPAALQQSLDGHRGHGGGGGIALAAGSLVVRRRVSARRLIEGLLALPWAVPGTVFAIALAALFSVRSPWTLRAVLVGTVWILPLAYLVRNLPITGRAVLAGFRQLDPSLEEAAASLGAGRWRTLRRVILPGLAPALAAGATLAFVTALGDFVTSIMLYTYDTRPISLEILGSLRQGDVGVAAAYGVLLMLASAGVFALGARGEARA